MCIRDRLGANREELLVMKPVLRQDLMKIREGVLSQIDMKRTWIRWSSVPADLQLANIETTKEKHIQINKLCTDIKTLLYDPKWELKSRRHKARCFYKFSLKFCLPFYQNRTNL
eukprot:TRINITY_DN24378_c0_g2_i2.p1 TRINITY_DN24378_c0_g2~~TRINITY_DN24378_c0_g2_i2.p1  ORF type:complete len:114 (-),score=8.15 TRINITY_DN24378_c0_g2_i2:88-429(-)